MIQKEKFIWETLKKAGFNDYGIAGLMGNLLAESGLNPINLEDSKNNSLHMSDIEYTKKVDNFSYKNFVHDSAGYGLAQWTWWSRKQALLSYARRQRKSIGDLEMQLKFLIQELKTKYTNNVYNILLQATSVKEASDAVLLHFEQPYDQSISIQEIRCKYGESYYRQFSKGGKNMSNPIYKKGKKEQLSTHFSSLEMDCHGNGCCSETLINPKLITYLEKIRSHFNRPITITSGYRCPIHNRNVGGATGSRHGKGDAADIVIQGVTPREVAKYAESIGILGIGLYETSQDGFFVHIDTRDKKSFWYGQKQAYRSTFGGINNNTTTPSKKPDAMYLIGSSGPGVQQLQKNLESLGYDLSPYGADGQYGNGTREAVKQFQKDNNLNPDGIAGPDTLNKINLKLSKNSNNNIKEVTANVLNVRAEGNINAPVVNQLLKGQKIKLLESKEGWGRIESPKGWVSLTYLK